MAQDISDLCRNQGWEPKAVIGHSAGAAIGLDMARHDSIEKLVGINPALDTFDGIAGVLFPAIARVLASVPFTARLFSGASANPTRALVHFQFSIRRLLLVPRREVRH